MHDADWKKKGMFGAAFAAYTGLIFYLSSLPGQSGTPLFTNIDKVEHICAYGFLAFSAWMLLRQWSILHPCWLWAWIIAVGHGAFTEWHQLVIPGRYADIWDLVADAVGAFLAIGILEFLRKRRNSQTIPLTVPDRIGFPSPCLDPSRS